MTPKKPLSTTPLVDTDLPIPPDSNAKPAPNAQPDLSVALNRLSRMTPEEQAAALFECMRAPRGMKRKP